MSAFQDEGNQRRYRFRLPLTSFLPGPEFYERERQCRYEEAVVKHILKRFDLMEVAKVLWKRRKKNDGFGRLASADLQAATGFPIWLVTRWIRLTQQHSLANLILHLPSGFILESLQQAKCEASEQCPTSPFGVVFPAAGAKFMVAHNWRHTLRSGVTRIEIPIGRRRTLILEELNTLLDALGPQDRWDRILFS
jgi:hypothetical protein